MHYLPVAAPPRPERERFVKLMPIVLVLAHLVSCDDDGDTTTAPDSSCVFTLAQRVCHLAVDGEGDFVLEDELGARTFMPALDVTLEDGGGLAAPGGGALVDESGAVVRVPPTKPNPTTHMRLGINFDSRPNVDESGVELTSRLEVVESVFDSLGRTHDVFIDFTRGDQGRWEWIATASQGSAQGPFVAMGTGLVTFDEQGRLTFASDVPIGLSFYDAEPQDVLVDLADDESPALASHSTPAPSEVFHVRIDGSRPVAFASASIAHDGAIEARYADDRLTDLGHLALSVVDAVGVRTLDRPLTGRRGGIVTSVPSPP